ncbi:MAG: ABC transporter ATP-binding protein [Victivallales bacterium]|nr:ABC transporter ATP-binding protein [Victivallales bacterium]
MITVEKLYKSFGRLRAVNGITFSVEKGEILGFLGPNGAGKSTTMRILTGYLKPTSGTVKFDNTDVVLYPEEIKEKIGYLPETAPVYKDMTVKGFLKFIARIRQVPDIDTAIRRVVELCSISSVYRRPIETLSKGYVQRVCLAQALLHDPEVLILDEPTDGLDPIQKKEIQELIKKMGERKTILISTHMLDEVEEYCNRIIIISEGRIKAEGDLNKVKTFSGNSNTLVLELSNDNAVKLGPFIFKDIKQCDIMFTKELFNDSVKYRFFPNGNISLFELMWKTFDYLRENNINFIDFKYDNGSLNDAFRSVVNPNSKTML